jgi:hypothetical protein
VCIMAKACGGGGVKMARRSLLQNIPPKGHHQTPQLQLTCPSSKVGAATCSPLKFEFLQPGPTSGTGASTKSNHRRCAPRCAQTVQAGGPHVRALVTHK